MLDLKIMTVKLLVHGVRRIAYVESYVLAQLGQFSRRIYAISVLGPWPRSGYSNNGGYSQPLGPLLTVFYFFSLGKRGTRKDIRTLTRTGIWNAPTSHHHMVTFNYKLF